MNRLRLAGVVFLAVAAATYFYTTGPMKTFPAAFLVIGIALIARPRRRDSGRNGG